MPEAEPGCAAAQFSRSVVLPVLPQRTIAMIAMTHMVRTWMERMARDTRLDPRIPTRHIRE